MDEETVWRLACAAMLARLYQESTGKLAAPEALSDVKRWLEAHPEARSAPPSAEDFMTADRDYALLERIQRGLPDPDLFGKN
jgi:hypothetical protein